MAVALVGAGALVSSFLQVAFHNSASFETMDYFRGRKLNENLMNKLNTKLLYFNIVVADVEQKQIINYCVKKCLDNVKDAMFDAEDLLDEINIHVSQCKLEAESQINTTSTKKICTLFNPFVSSFDKEIDSRMQEMLDRLEFYGSNFGLMLSGSFVVRSQLFPSTCFPSRSSIYGRDHDKEIIIDWLISDTEMLSVISLVGMGGIGKTALARHLFNDPMLEGIFDLTSWVFVSEEFDVCKVMREILEDITGHTIDANTDMNTLQVKLKKMLTWKRVLLVLDDVWNENYMQWKALKTSFDCGGQGSKIIVTTRSKRVASVMQSNNIHQLEQLEEEHSWKLFAKYAFKNKDDSQINPNFENIGKQIIKKCQGLPLALVNVGRILCIESSLIKWKKFDLHYETRIICTLISSYYQLSSHLKRCFAYCALFPKRYLFEKEHLILLWMAENFLQCPEEKSMSMREVGEQYFNDLLSRSFFQESRTHKMHFVMHELLNDLAKHVSGDFCFKLEDKEVQNISTMARHFSFSCDKLGSFKGLETLYNANRLRTFLPFSLTSHQHRWSLNLKSSTLMLRELFSKFKFLRVLSLSGYWDMIELPDTIGDLKHLRHLDLSRTRIRKLPNSLCSLYNLQVLKLRDCEYFEELPLNLHKLVNLCYLDFSGTKVRKMPMNMGKLTNLEVLSSFYVDKGSEFNIQQSRKLNLHGKLSILELQNIVNPMDALTANLKSKVHLEKLELTWNANSDNSHKEREVLEMLQPSKHLKKLSIKSYGGTMFPYWFEDNSLSNVVSLKLRNCGNCVSLPALGVLPSLKHLQIIGLSGIVCISREFYENVSIFSHAIPFPFLETLTFKDMKGWEEWKCEVVSGVFPRLQKLSIVRCPNLKNQLPKKLDCLVNLEIIDCEQLVASVPFSPTIHELRLTNCGKMQFDYPSPTLKYLEIRQCCMERSSGEWIGHCLSRCHSSIKSLKIEDFPTMNIPQNRFYIFLVKLDIIGSCDSLRTFSLDLFPKLDSLNIYKCSKLEMISQKHEHLKLTSLSIEECPKFASFTEGGLSAPRLQHFNVSKLESFKYLPECMHNLLPSLYKLSIGDCPLLESFSDGGLPSSLRTLFIVKCSKLLIDSLKWALPTNTSLYDMSIQEVDVESFPDQGLLPSSLTRLTITGCQNLKQLERLPSLTTLTLHNCPNNLCFPEDGLPKSISTLQIFGNCSLLKQKCKKGTWDDCGKLSNMNWEYWGKISHIECIMMDD